MRRRHLSPPTSPVLAHCAGRPNTLLPCRRARWVPVIGRQTFIGIRIRTLGRVLRYMISSTLVIESRTEKLHISVHQLAHYPVKMKQFAEQQFLLKMLLVSNYADAAPKKWTVVRNVELFRAGWVSEKTNSCQESLISWLEFNTNRKKHIIDFSFHRCVKVSIHLTILELHELLYCVQHEGC